MTLLATRDRGTAGAAHVLLRPSLAQEVFSASRRVRLLAGAIPGSIPLYAVEGDPHPDLLTNLVSAGGTFSVATPPKLYACLAAGARGETLVLGHLVAPEGTPERSAVFANCVEIAARAGVRRYVVGSAGDCRIVAEHAPGSSVLCRVGAVDTVSTEGYRPRDAAVSVLLRAASLGLDPAGVTVHVGARRHDPRAWRAPIAAAGSIWSTLRRAGHRLRLLGLGGGLPTSHDGGVLPLSAFAEAIDLALRQEFGIRCPRTLVELGAPLAWGQ